MGLLRNIRLARYAERIVADGHYCVGGNVVELPRADFRAVEVVSPEDGFGEMFDEVCFAIRGRTEDAKFLAFKNVLNEG